MTESAKSKEYPDIYDILPLRYPYLMVDRILERTPEKAVALKNVSNNEQVFVGHFPGIPIMPGTLITEGMAQTCGVLVQFIEETPFAQGLLVGVDRAKFKKQVVPGDQLIFEATLLKSRGGLYKFSAETKVDGEIVAEANISLMSVSMDQL
jgi:3-hydroxyacyl-[acyl-carrier-protein] dehydratase